MPRDAASSAVILPSTSACTDCCSSPICSQPDETSVQSDLSTRVNRTFAASLARGEDRGGIPKENKSTAVLVPGLEEVHQFAHLTERKRKGGHHVVCVRLPSRQRRQVPVGGDEFQDRRVIHDIVVEEAPLR